MASIEANYIQLQRDFSKLQRAHLELHEEHARLLAANGGKDVERDAHHDKSTA